MDITDRVNLAKLKPSDEKQITADRAKSDVLFEVLNKMGNYLGTNSSLESIRYYFASRNSTFNEIWNIAYNLSCQMNEQVLDIFILTLIDHWDNERERYVLLCERSLIALDYDFERLEVRQLILFEYSRFDVIRIGPLSYPDMSVNSYAHQSKLAMRFCWDSKRKVNLMDKWNPWSKEIPWITLTSHPLQHYIGQILLEAQAMARFDDDSYFTLDYLQQIQPRYSIEIFHNRLLEIVNSFQRQRLPIPRLIPGQSTPGNMLIELVHPDSNITIVYYASIICENYFNIPAIIYNRSRVGYYRLRLF